MTTGRTSEYTEEVIKAAQDYVDGGWMAQGDKVPMIAGLAMAIGKSRETCYAWGKDKEKQVFSDILKKIMAIQERELINNGLGGDFNPAITKMMMTKHGYSDKQEISGPDGKPIETNNQVSWTVQPVKPINEQDA